MALAIDAVSSAGGAGLGPFTWSHANAGTLMLMNVSWYRTLSTPNQYLFNSIAFTAVPGSLIQDTDFNSQWYYLINPAIGTLTASASFGTTSTYEASFTLYSFTGGELTIPYGDVDVATGTGTTPSVVLSSAADEMVLDGGIIVHNGTLSVGAGQTSRLNTIGTNGFNKYFSSNETGAASTTMDWTNGTSQLWVTSAVAVKPASGGGGGGGSFKSAFARNTNSVL